jgi:hypothetical protein
MSAAAAAIRTVRAEMLGLQRQRIAVVSFLSDDDLPEVIMYNGDPFLLDRGLLGIAYRQARAFRVDAGA